MLALSIYAATARLVSSRPPRALAGFLGAQAALLFAYSLWSGIKEVAAAAMIALVCASVAATIPRWGSSRRDAAERSCRRGAASQCSARPEGYGS